MTAALVDPDGWSARTVVVKYGGHAMSDGTLAGAFVADVLALRAAGAQVVVAHGGGPQISSMLARLGVASQFRGGFRVTTPEVMDVVRMVLTGQVQREVVSLLNVDGPHAVGISGEDAHLFTAERRDVLVDGNPTDIGLVGEVVHVRTDLLRTLLDDGLVPVVSSIARGSDGTVYNVNADLAASALAVALRADRLVMLTDVEGLYDDWPASTRVVGRIGVDELAALLPTLASGMVPKMEACLDAVRGGVASAHVVDGRVPVSPVLQAFAEPPAGTSVVPTPTAAPVGGAS